MSNVNQNPLQIASVQFPFSNTSSHSDQIDDAEPPTKMTRLAITEDREEDRFSNILTVKCWRCNPICGAELPDATDDPKVRSLSF
jgi:ubiquitin carboxyl-terminal hydrolase 5/13